MKEKPRREESMEKISEEIATVRADIKDLKKKLDEVVSALNRIAENMNTYTTTNRGFKDTSQRKAGIPADEASKMMACLSNSERIKILQELLNNAKYFKDLLKSTKITHSPLRFHLRLLLDSGYIGQERERGKYLITTKGENALEVVSRIMDTVDQSDNQRTVRSIVSVQEVQPEWLKHTMETDYYQQKVYS